MKQMTNRRSRTDLFPELVRAEDTVKNYKDISQRMASKVFSSIRFTCIKPWNNLPRNMVDSQSIQNNLTNI